MGHYAKTISEKGKKRRKKKSLKSHRPKSISRKIVEENFTNLKKEMPREVRIILCNFK